MHIISFFLAAITLIPQPRKMLERSGVSDVTNVTDVVDNRLPPEGYRLQVNPVGITIVSSSESGAFYARQTLSQLTEGGMCSCVEIEDAPSYRWRGVHLDECRHFFGKCEVKKTLDLMAKHKLNVLHWHLTEDQGWRLEIPGYPELLEFSATRPSSPLPGGKCMRTTAGDDVYEQDGMRYGPYCYNEADVREIVAYAALRHITIVPEIELPGHVASALAAYPDLACRPEKCAHRHPRLGWGIDKEVLCAGNTKAIKFMEDVLDYVCRVFPGPYVHIGGDECPRERWSECPKCLRFVREKGLKSIADIQPWITRHFVTFLEKRGKRAIGWDECLDGDVPASMIGMSWRTPGQGVPGIPIPSSTAAAEQGHDIVVVTHNFTYFCYGQGLRNDPFHGRSWGRLTLEKVYSFNPCLGIPERLHGRILGGQCCNWSERTHSPAELEWKMWPRACAIAEALWLGAEKPGYADFLKRMRVHRDRLIADYVNCAPLE